MFSAALMGAGKQPSRASEGTPASESPPLDQKALDEQNQLVKEAEERYKRKALAKSQKRTIQLNDKVIVGKKQLIGRVVYIGLQRTVEAVGKWYGIQFTKPVGNMDGILHGHEYFRCPQNHGRMVRRKLLKLFSYRELDTGSNISIKAEIRQDSKTAKPSSSSSGGGGIAAFKKQSRSERTYILEQRERLNMRKLQLNAELEEVLLTAQRIRNELTSVDVHLSELEDKTKQAQDREGLLYRDSQFHRDLKKVVNKCRQLKRSGVSGGVKGLHDSRWERLIDCFLDDTFGSHGDTRKFRDELIGRRYTSANTALRRQIDIVWGPDRKFYARLAKNYAIAQGLDPDDAETAKQEADKAAAKADESESDLGDDLSSSSSSDEEDDGAQKKSKKKTSSTKMGKFRVKNSATKSNAAALFARPSAAAVPVRKSATEPVVGKTAALFAAKKPPSKPAAPAVSSSTASMFARPMNSSKPVSSIPKTSTSAFGARKFGVKKSSTSSSIFNSAAPPTSKPSMFARPKPAATSSSSSSFSSFSSTATVSKVQPFSAAAFSQPITSKPPAGKSSSNGRVRKPFNAKPKAKPAAAKPMMMMPASDGDSSDSYSDDF
jgi:hypothetical protein